MGHDVVAGRRAGRGGDPARRPRGRRRPGGPRPGGRHRRRPGSTGCWPTRHEPELTTYDRYGNRIDEVVFHPSWHWLMERAVGLRAAGRTLGAAGEGRAHAHVRRAAGFLAWSQTEPGARLPDLDDLRRGAGAARRRRDRREWTPALASTTYDPGIRPLAEKRGALAGMGMTEKQGGSDVRANVTEARPTGGRRGVHPARPQVVHLGADERRVPGARAGARRAVLLRGAARAARRHAQPARRGPAQGQARQPLQRLGRARARRHPGPPARRRGPRRAHHHRDGRRDPARLRARLGRR